MDKILVLDFGGQYSLLIARRIREMHVYAEVVPSGKITAGEIAETCRGVILTGGPRSVYEPGAPVFDRGLLSAGVPVLGICYGHQLLSFLAGGSVGPAASSGEYGRVTLKASRCALFDGVPETSACWMSHRDEVTVIPDGFGVVAVTDKCASAAVADEKRKLYGVQFHPEVVHTEYGRKVLENFVTGVCGCRAEWRMEDFVSRTAEKYAAECAGKRVLLALSGGVDSSVAAALMHRAVGDRLACVFVDHGLLRKGEADAVEKTFRDMGVDIVRVNAAERFFSKLAGVTDPERKRKIIGGEFIRVFEEESARLGRMDLLCQGTIYPDVIESGAGSASVIKSHHNVGGLPSVTDFSGIVEPLATLFKDEVREAGLALGLPESLVYRQPFPGPGMAVRIIGEVTPEKADLLREADAVFREEVEAAGLGRSCSQYFAVLTDTRSVGVMGDSRTYGYTVALRAVTTDDFMTADWTRLPFEVLEKASGRIASEIRGINRVVYDITSKPPATVEWE